MDRRLRIDLSDQLTHWFKPVSGDLKTDFATATTNLVVCGAHPPYVLGPRPCVAFTEVPLTIAAKLLPDSKKFGINYAPVGFVFDRSWLFEQGARPVIYQSEAEAALLPLGQRYRHVTLDFQRGIDFTWKREWRWPGDRLEIDPRHCHPVVPTYDVKRHLEDISAKWPNLAAFAAKTVVLEAWV